MKNLLVTGGAGFIGSNFIRYWSRNHGEDRIVNLDALTYAGNLDNLADLEGESNYRFVHGSIDNADIVGQLFEREKIDTVVNFAAESHVDRSIVGPGPFLQTNVNGTFTLLEAARSAWQGECETCRFLHISTDEVYGSLGSHDAPFTELTPYAPNSPYSASKAASDHLVRAWFHTYGLPVLTTNCSNNYGPFQFPEKLIPLVILNGLEGRPIPVFGDGKNVRDWLYVEDHCRGIDVVLNRGIPGETYNIGGCNEWANIDIVRHLCKILDAMSPSESSRESLIAFVEDRPGHDRRYAINSRKLSREFAWEPEYSFEDGIVKTVQWYLDHPDWARRIQSGEYRQYYRR